MSRKLVRTAPIVVALVLAMLLPASGLLAQTTGGNLEGTRRRRTAAPLPGVTVTATNTGTGLTRTATTDDRRRLTGSRSLPVGDLQGDLQPRAASATSTIEQAVVNVGSTTRGRRGDAGGGGRGDDHRHRRGAAHRQPSPSIGTVVSQKELENLPLNGRQFANLAVLAPGTALAYNSDPTKPGQLTVALNGGIGRNVNFIDRRRRQHRRHHRRRAAELQPRRGAGVQDPDQPVQGRVRPLERRRAVGGHQDRHQRLRGQRLRLLPRRQPEREDRDREARGRRQAADYERDQYGASLGGPIVRDKAHFFATYEKTRARDTSYTVDTGGVVPRARRPVARRLPFEDELITAKVTVDVDGQAVPAGALRLSRRTADKYGASPLAAPDALGTVTNEYESILAGHTAQIGADSAQRVPLPVHQVRQPDQRRLGQPDALLPVAASHSGQNLNTPQTTHQTKYQYKDDFSLVDRPRRPIGTTSRSASTTSTSPTLGGDFSTGTRRPVHLLTNDRAGSPVADITSLRRLRRRRHAGRAVQRLRPGRLVRHRPADAQPRPALRLLGRASTSTSARTRSGRRSPPRRTLQRVLPARLPGRRGRRARERRRQLRAAPRLHLRHQGRRPAHPARRLRARFYDFPYTNATILFPSAAVQSNYGVIYNLDNPAGIRNPDGSFFQPGQPLPPERAAGGAGPRRTRSPRRPSRRRTRTRSRSATPGRSTTGSASTSRRSRIDYHDIPFRFRANGRLRLDGDPLERARFPQFGNFRIWYGGGRGSYDGVNLGVRVRRDKFELQGFYTYSEAEGNMLAGADEFRVTDADQPDYHGARTRRSAGLPRSPLRRLLRPLYTDAEHRVTLAGIYRAVRGASTCRASSATARRPYTVSTAECRRRTLDLNGDGFCHDLAPGVDSVNSERGEDFSQLDLGVSKEFRFGDSFGIEIIGEVFNVLDDENPAHLRPLRRAELLRRRPAPG